MVLLELIIFALVISSGVLGRDTRRGNVKHRQAEDEYKYNHPPTPENYEAIPVAVVYENESNREDKSIKSTMTSDNKIVEVSKDPLVTEPNLRKEPPSAVAVNKDEINVTEPTKTKETESKVTTYRPLRDHQIPVAVVYEPEPTQKPRRNRNKVANKRRRIQEHVTEENSTEDNIKSTSQVNGHTGPELVPSSSKNVDFDKRQKSIRPNSEKQSILKDNTPSQAQGNRRSSLLSSKTEEPEKPQILKLAAEYKIQDETNPTLKTQEELNKKQNIQPLKAEIKETVKETKRPSLQVNDNTSSVRKVNKSEQFITDNDQHFRKRDNSTRIREVIPIVQSENVVFSHSGNFKYSYEGGDGTKAFETGELKSFDNETAGEAVSGGFSYTGNDGNEYSLSYTADENGYRPVGAHLPTPPPIPPAIARALAYLATKTTPEPVTESIAENRE